MNINEWFNDRAASIINQAMNDSHPAISKKALMIKIANEINKRFKDDIDLQDLLLNECHLIYDRMYPKHNYNLTKLMRTCPKCYRRDKHDAARALGIGNNYIVSITCIECGWTWDGKYMKHEWSVK